MRHICCYEQSSKERRFIYSAEGTSSSALSNVHRAIRSRLTKAVEEARAERDDFINQLEEKRQTATSNIFFEVGECRLQIGNGDGLGVENDATGDEVQRWRDIRNSCVGLRLRDQEFWQEDSLVKELDTDADSDEEQYDSSSF